MKKILFIDDDVEYQAILSELLIYEGYDVVVASTPLEGIEKFKDDNYDLVITDLIMNNIDGLQLISLLKRINTQVPVIILTGHTSDQKEIRGFELDIYDYIYKPVSMEVLLKRIERVLKFESGSVNKLISRKDKLEVDLENRKVTKNGSDIHLTIKEYSFICFLLSNKNKVFTREELLNKVWHVDESIVDVRTVDTHVKNLRSKLNIESIISVRGMGYEWSEKK